MAKRPTTRSHTDDSAMSMSAQPRARRARATTAPVELDTQPVGATTVRERPVELDPEPASHRQPVGYLESASRTGQPSEDEIRVRAYQRFIERGATHGMAFDDWLEAEKELKPRG
jgi:hypothetical protein